MTQPASMGFSALLLADPGASLSSSSEIYEYTGPCGLALEQEIVETDGTRGTRSLIDERTRPGLQKVGGTVTLPVDTTVMRKWFPRILGAAESGSNPYAYAVAETIPSFTVGVSRIAKDYIYGGCYINKATLRGRQGELIDIELDIQGKTETSATAGTFAGYGISEPTGSPFFFADATMTIGGTTYSLFDFEIGIDNMLILDRYMNSVTRTALPASKRMVSFSTNTPFTTDELALYAAGATSAAVVITLTNGSHVIAITLAAVQYPARSPVVGGKTTEIKLPLIGVARQVGSTKEISVSLSL